MLWGGILNLSTRIGAGSKLSFNNTYNRGGDNEATRLAGENEEFAVDLDVTRLTFTQRTVRSHQLAGEHLLGQRHLVDWSFSASRVDRYEPDRSDIAYITQIDPATGASHPTAWLGGPRSATRTFSDLGESSYEGGGNYRILLGSSSNPASIKVGGSYRAVSRDVDSRAFDITNRALSEADRQVVPEQIFAGPYAEDSRLSLFINANGGRYDARDHLGAGYAQLELPLGSALRLIGGARLEHWNLDLNTLSPQGLASDHNAKQYRCPACAGAQLSADREPDHPGLGQSDVVAPRVSRDRERQLVRADRGDHHLRKPDSAAGADSKLRPAVGVVSPFRRGPQHRTLRQALRGSDRTSTASIRPAGSPTVS